MFRADVTEALAPVGETEFVQGVAAMSSSGTYGDCRVAAGIVSFADLTLGAQVRPVLEAHIAASVNRFRGIRHAASWHTSPDIRISHADPVEHQMLQDHLGRARVATMRMMNLPFLFLPSRPTWK